MTAPPLPSVFRLALRGSIVIGTLVAVGVLLRYFDAGSMLNADWIDAEVRSHGAGGYLLFLAAGAAFTAVGLPRQILCFLGGYAFGFVAGTGIALAATVIGCAVTFLFARLAGRGLIAPRLPRRLERADTFFAEHPFSLTLLIRLLPVGSNVVTNLVGGLSSAALLPFLAGSALGHLPQSAIFALIGSGIHIDPEARISIGIVLFALSLAIGAYLYNRFRQSGAFGAAMNAMIGDGNAHEPAPSAGEAARSVRHGE